MADKKISDFSVATTLNNTDEIILGVGNSWYRITYLAFKNLLATLTTEQINKINSVVIAGNGNQFATDNGEYRTLTIDDLPNTVLSLNSLFANIGNGISISKSVENNQAIFKLDINTYTSGMDYTVGYWVLYDNSLYQCTTAHTSTSTFDVTKWDIKVGGSSADTMLKSVYDTNGDGIVDNAEKVNNHTVLIDVPANAVFTDTVTTVEDSVTSTSATNALSANQGKVVNDKVVNIENGTTKTNAQKIQGVNVSETTPTSNQVLLYNETNSQYEPTTITVDVPVASTTVSGTVKIDGTTITIADGVISAINTGTKIEDWVSGTSYLLKDLVIYSDSIYQCTTANSDATWTPANWNCVSTGADGVNAYVHIKYSTIQPIQDSDMTDTPSDWIGIYSGTSATAPTTYTSYIWYKIKGDTGVKGETGDSGTDGSHIYYGTACTGTSETGVVFDTDITNANVDDMYINTSTSNLYRCNLGGNDTVATWVYVNSLKGADGTVQINDISTNSTTETWSVNKINTAKQDKITVSSTLTLTVAGWDSGTKTQKVSITLNTNNVNSIIYDLSSLDMVIASGVIPSLEETTGITFKCTTIPTSDINFKVKVTVIT